MPEARVLRIALTGGPAGGKSSALSVLSERLEGLGWRVFQVPEAATMLLKGGHSFARLDAGQQYDFQKTLLLLMLQLEDSFVELARSSRENCVVICDRGTMDPRSYMSMLDWDRLMKDLDTDTMRLRDTRYDAVIHMVTSANGAEEFYTIEGHAARSETPEVARELDERGKRNWIGHPCLHVIDNSTDFQGKLKRVIEALAPTLGMPQDIGVSKRKFLVDAAFVSQLKDLFPSDLVVHAFTVEHTYVVPSVAAANDVAAHDAEMLQLRLCKRTRVGDEGSSESTWSSTLRYPSIHGQRLELKRMLKERDYVELMLHRDPTRTTLHKIRFSFLWENRYYKVDVFDTLALVEIYGKQGETEGELVAAMPSWLHVTNEVTNDLEYAMYSLALLPPVAAAVNEESEQEATA